MMSSASSAGAVRIQHRWLHIEIEIALAPGREHDAPAPERALLEELEQLCALRFRCSFALMCARLGFATLA